MKIDPTLFGLLLLDFLVYSAFSLPLPFFPKLAKNKGISESIIGLIFGCFNIGSALSSLLYGKLMFFFKKKQLLKINMVLNSLAVMSFGTLNQISNKQMFTTIGCTSRLVTGFISGGIVTIIFGFLPSLYPDDVPQKQAYFEIAFSCASVGGSVFGGLLYKFVNFQLPFVIVGCSYLIIGCPIVHNLPDIEQIQHQQLKQKLIESNVDHQDIQLSSRQNVQKLKFTMFLGNPRFLCTALFTMIQILTQAFTYSTLQLNLNRFEDGEEYVLYAFGVSSVVYGLFCIIFSKVLPKWVDQRYYIVVGTLVMILSLSLVGPISCFGITRDIRLFFIGITVQYVFLGLAVFTMLNEMCVVGTSIDDQLDQTQVTDMCSGIFVSAVSVGGFTGPIVAGLLIQHYSFETSFAILFCFCMVVFIMYMTIGQGWQLLITRKYQCSQQLSDQLMEMVDLK